MTATADNVLIDAIQRGIGLCQRCFLPISKANCWCPTCHRHVMNDIAERERLPCGYKMMFPFVPPPVPEKGKNEKPVYHDPENSIKNCRNLIRWMSSQCRCAGNPGVWKDDEDGASASWGRIVREYEELGDMIL